MNTDSTNIPDVSPEEEAINRNYKYSGFWRRVFAYSIDAILLGIVGLVLGFTFYDHFLSIGQTGRLYGLVIYLTYFATMNSKIGNGQTLGKRMLGIKVVGQDGCSLEFKRAFSRQAIVAAPIFLNGVTVSIGPYIMATTVLLGIIVFGIGGAIGYFLIFNAKTRRTLHDFICGSHVVKVEKEKSTIVQIPLWKGHFAILALIVVGVGTGGFLAGRWAQSSFDFTQITALYNKLNEQDNVKQAGVHISKNSSFRNGQENSYTILQLVASPPYPISSNSEYAMQVVAVALEDETILPKSDIIAFTLSTGFDLGIARKHTTQSASDTPSNWKAAIEHYQTEGTAPIARFSSHTQIRF